MPAPSTGKLWTCSECRLSAVLSQWEACFCFHFVSSPLEAGKTGHAVNYFASGHSVNLRLPVHWRGRGGGLLFLGPGCLRLPLFEGKKWCGEIESWCANHLIQKPSSAKNLLGGKKWVCAVECRVLFVRVLSAWQTEPWREVSSGAIVTVQKRLEKPEGIRGRGWEASFPEIRWPSVVCVDSLSAQWLGLVSWLLGDIRGTTSRSIKEGSECVYHVAIAIIRALL